MDQITALIILTVFPLCMIFATFYDLFTMTIPNKISLVLLVAFAVLAPLAGMGWETAAWHVGVALLVLGIGFALAKRERFHLAKGQMLNCEMLISLCNETC